MRTPLCRLLLALLCRAALAQTPTVGSGAPNAAITSSFLQAYYRNGFNNLVVSPPIGNVKALGASGLVQEFTDATNSANKYALVKPSITAPPLAGGLDVVQMYPALYAYYTSLGTATVGYPTMDTANCPPLVSISNSCQYQLFNQPYALFSFANALTAGSNFGVANPIYAKWISVGGIGTAGPAVSATSSVTSASANVATVQTFDRAMIFNITSGTLSTRIVAVGPGVFSTYLANGGPSGFLGFPVTDEQVQPNGHKRQAFEGGSIDYDPSGATPPSVLYPISSITVTPSGPLKLNQGDTVTLVATALDPNGVALSGRTITWSTSNGRVLSLQPSSLTVIVQALTGGNATVTASGEGKASKPVTITVIAPCCGIGEGAPTTVIQQAFQDAATRNQLNVKLPATSPVMRSGAGYIQSLVDAGTGAPYLLAISDQGSSAYLVSGALLAAYLNLGGPSGPLGYPASDANAAGRQLFVNQAALAGNPVQQVAGIFLSKWAALNYEAGAAGAPTGPQASVLSFRATAGIAQAFANGTMVAAQTGPNAGMPHFVGGLIAAAYAASGGATGSLGLPLSDQYVSNGLNHQDFEGGSIDYANGDAAAQAHPGARNPLVTATPSTVLTGTRVRLTLGGFNAGATVKVSVTGQPDFTVTTASGAYVWDNAVSASAKSGTVAIHAVDTSNPAVSADASYTVVTPSALVVQMKKASGDNQTGAPGGLLPLPLDVLVTDSSSNAVAGIPVTFGPSPGAQIVTAAVVTDSNGHAQATLRLPPNDGLVLITAAAGKQLVTFGAQALHTSLASFPKQSQSAQAGDLVTVSAAILRYYQNQGLLPTPHGAADPIALNGFLQTFCALDYTGAQICDGFLATPDSSQTVNLWRLAAFVGGNLTVSVERTNVSSIRDLLGQGNPVIVELNLGSGGTHYVVGIGVNADGSIAIMDPNPASGQTNLSAYLTQASITGAVRLLPKAPPSGFLISGSSPFQLASPVGACGTPLQLGQLTALFCDGSQGAYELDSSGAGGFQVTLTDLGSPGARGDLSGAGFSAFAITHASGQWTAQPQITTVSTGGVVNAASYTGAIAPQGLFTVFGTGLAGGSNPTAMTLSGQAATVLAASPFQVSAALPPGLGPGTYSLTVTSPLGSAAQAVTLLPNAPAIFLVGGTLGAILNLDGTLNSPDNPAIRGSVIVVYCTGLGATVRQGGLDVASSPVTALLNGIALKPAFAGLTPGYLGLYQVNVPIPGNTPPGLGLTLLLQQGGIASNSVQVAIQ